jgi:DNA-binding response OmpR family regulator
LHRPLPDDAVFAGFELYVQWHVLDPAAPGGGARSELAKLTLFCPDAGPLPRCASPWGRRATMRILVVEDYAPLRKAVSKALREEGYSVDEAEGGGEALLSAGSDDYDVVLLDLMLPGMDGLEVLRRLRAGGARCQVLILTARDAVDDRVRGLDLGADDYLVKPFAMEELLARVRALVRRMYARKSPTLRVGHVELDTLRREVQVAGEAVRLTAREYALLEYLAMRSGEVVSRTEIWQHVYDEESSTSSNVVDVYVGYLRKKLERPELPRLLHTRRGEGYVLEAPGA